MSDTPSPSSIKRKLLIVVISFCLLLPCRSASVLNQTIYAEMKETEVNQSSSSSLETATVMPEMSSTIQSNNENSWKMNLLDLPKEVIGELIAPLLFEEIPFLLNLNLQSRADLCQTTALSLYLATKYNAPFFERLRLDESFLSTEQEYIQSQISFKYTRSIDYLLDRINVSLNPTGSFDAVILAIVDYFVETEETYPIFDTNNLGEYAFHLVFRTWGLTRFLEASHLFSEWRDFFVNQPNLPDLIENWFYKEQSALWTVFFEHCLYLDDKFLTDFFKAPSTFFPDDLSVATTKPFFEDLKNNALSTPDPYGVPAALIYSKFGPYLSAKPNEMSHDLLHDFNFRYNPTFQVNGPINEREAALLVAAGRFEDAFKFFEETPPYYIRLDYLKQHSHFCLKLIDRIPPKLYQKFFRSEFPCDFFTDPVAIPQILKVMEADSISDLINNHLQYCEIQKNSGPWALFFMSAGSLEDFRVFLEKVESTESIFPHIVAFNKDKKVDDFIDYLRIFESVAMQKGRQCEVELFHYYSLDLMNRPDVLRFMASSSIFKFGFKGLLKLFFFPEHDTYPEESRSIIKELQERATTSRHFYR